MIRREETQEQARAALETERDARRQLLRAQGVGKLGSWEVDLESDVLTWSDMVFRIFEIDRQDFGETEEAFFELIHPDDRPEFLEARRVWLEYGGPFLFEHRILTPRGKVKWVVERAEIITNQSGQPVFTTGTVQDVTDLKVAELERAEARRELSLAQNLIRIAGEKAHVGGWRVDLDGPTIHWSDETALIHGMPRGHQPSLEEAINFYVEEDRDKVSKAFNLTASEGVPFDFTARLKTATGKIVWVRSHGEAVRDEEGAIVAVHGAFQDITDLVKARDHAEQVQEELFSTLENIDDGFFTVDHEWRFQYLNRHAENLLQRSREELEGKNIWEEFPEAVGTSFEGEYQTAIYEQRAIRFREHFRPLDLWAEVTAYPVPNGLAVYFRDIGDQLRKDERLALLETAVSRMNDILMITEAEPLDAPDGPKILYVNEAFQHRTGYALEEVIGKTPRVLQGSGTDKQELKRIGRHLREWQPVRSELMNYTKSGEPFWLELDIAPIADETGWFTHWVAIERDITERKRALESERRAQEMFRLVSEVTNDFVWEYDVENDAWFRTGRHRELLGLQEGDTPLSLSETVEIVHPEDQDRFLQSFRAALGGVAQSWELEYRIIDGDGRTRQVQNEAAIVRDEEGTPVRVVGGLTDVTEVHELDRQLREAQKMEAIGQLTGGVAHDFNNLLTVILGNAEELSDQLTGDKRLRILAEMTATAAERGAELTNQLLAFARRQTLNPQVIDLNRQLQHMDSLLRRTLPETISIEYVRAGGLWMATLDPGLLQGAILNLAINARDAMPEGGKLTIETANVHLDSEYARHHDEVEAGQYVMVSITDTGVGMDRATQESAFEPFFTTKSVGEGTGLGLSSVYGFVKQSFGHIKLYSEVGEGTTVKLYFPRIHGNDAEASQGTGEEHIVEGSERILIVEDDELLRENLERQLERLGYKVTSAQNGIKALEKLKNENTIYDMLLTDVVMPGGINGRELAEQAIELRPNLKVLFTSGYTENAIVHQGRLKPNVHLLQKPYRRQVLAEKVREVLDE